jgi:hypothetical protein
MARLDTGWHANPKVLKTGYAGMGLHAWSISYSDHARSDGFIPHGAWPSLPGAAGLVKMLVAAGLWEPAEGGYRLHDYPVYNRLRAQIEADQEDARTRQSRHRSRVTTTVTTPVTNTVSNGVTLARSGNPVPVPGDAPPIGGSASPPIPYPFPEGAPFEPSARRASPTTTSVSAADAIATLYGPRQEVERLPNGAQQCPLCPVIFTGTYADHLAERHKVRAEPDDLSDFHA